MSGSLAQPLPLPTSPFVDPATGIITEQWLSFLANLSTRTGGSAGPSAPLTIIVQDGVDAQALSIMSDVQEPAVAVAAQDDWIGAMADVPDQIAPDDAALLALMLSDWS